MPLTLFQALFYGVAVFVSSACGLVIEIVAGRLLAPYVGMSLYTWTAIIAVVLAGLSAGHWIGGLLAPPQVDARRGARRVAAALAGAAVSSLASLVLLRVLAGFLLGGGLDAIPAIVALTTALFLLPSLFVGIVSPILTKLAVDGMPGRHGRVIGTMYALGTLGSIAGTLLAGYLFISWIGSTGTVLTVAGVYAALALAFAAADRLRVLVVAVLLAAGGGLAWWGGAVRAFDSPCRIESDYFCIRIDDFSAETGRPSRLMALDHLVHSINDRDDPGLLYSPYIHFVGEVTRRRLGAGTPIAAFFIGGGGFTLPRAWSVGRPGSDLVVAELDPQVSRAAEQFLWWRPAAPGVSVLHRDARAALAALPAARRFDLVFGDAFHDISIPAHLVSREFHQQIAARLKPGGFYVVNVVDRGDNPRFLFALVKTLGQDFASVEAWVDPDEAGDPGQGHGGRTTFVVVASATGNGDDGRLVASHGLRRAWLRWNPADLAARVAASDSPVLSDDFAPVDRLMSGLLLGAEP
ncbi:MAG: fused MFS/spermidine synthase [Hyphomicrobiales bacterium]|nr:fused MFS/spermidine synthase [Hyphomicrobiales bacterium]